MFATAKSFCLGQSLNLWILDWERSNRGKSSKSCFLLMILFSTYSCLVYGPWKALSHFLFPKTHGFQLCAAPGRSNWNVRAHLGRRRPRCLWAARTRGFRCGALVLFAFLLINLLTPHLSTSLKRPVWDALRNRSLCGLSGLVSICGEGEFACLRQREMGSAGVTMPLVSCHIYSYSSLQESGFLMECLCSLCQLPVGHRETLPNL